MSRSGFHVPCSEPTQSQDEDESFGPQAQLPEVFFPRSDIDSQRSLEFPSSAEAQEQMAALLANSQDENAPLSGSPTHDLPQDDLAGQADTQSIEATQTEPDIPEHTIQQTGASTGTSGARSIISLIDPAKLHRYKALLSSSRATNVPRSIPERHSPESAPPIDDHEYTQPAPTSTGVNHPAQARSPSPTPPPPVFESEGDETQITSSANLPATGHLAPPTFSPQPAEPEAPSDDYLYEETQPSTASNLPPTGQRIAQELRDSPASRTTVKSDSEASREEMLRGPTMSPIIPSPDPTPPQARETSTRSAQPPPRSRSMPKTPRKQSQKSPRRHDISEEIPDSIVEDDDATEEEEVREAVARSLGKEEEEESSDEQSIPLAEIVGARKPLAATAIKGKRTRGLSGTLMPPPPKKEKTTARARTTVARATRSHGPATGEVISSSVSYERVEKPKVERKSTQGKAAAAAPKNKVAPTKGKGKGKKAAAPKPATPAPDDDSDEEGVEEEGEQPGEGAIPDEQRTEAADDDASIDADGSLPAPGTSSRKRKRVAPASTRSVRSSTHPGGSTMKKLTRASTTTPRPAKRIKVEPEELKNSGATRVMALWNSDLYYYPGTVLSEVAPGRFHIKFDDGYEGEADLQDMRALEFQPKDHVCFIRGGRKGEDLSVVVVSVDDEQETVVVEDDIDNKKHELPVSKLKVFNKTVCHEWENRQLTVYQIEPYEKPAIVATPSGRSVTSSTASTSGGCHKSRLFAKVGFAVTLYGDGWCERRGELSNKIKAHGGATISDWADVFTMNGKQENLGKRWILKMEEVKGPKNGKLDTVFLLANEPTHKPKFLMALALGIPCLSVKWLEDSVRDNERKPWLGYLLHTGESSMIKAHMSQIVDYNWHRSPSYVTHIMDNPVPIKLFNEKHILCISPAFVPASRKGSVNDSGKVESKIEVPRIILCMGASVVEAVTSLTYASKQDFEQDYDYLVIEPGTFPEATEPVKRFKNWVPFKWVKECLVTGRLLPKQPFIEED
ncbi:hypothetical protein BC629DRAFT_657918 [Irpex lacteus]|nr:hypothetical protein BC629DRAFT_657918 [Irpex lacteus]